MYLESRRRLRCWSFIATSTIQRFQRRVAVWAGPHRKRRVQHALAQFFSFLYNVLYIMYICVFLPTGIYQKCWRTNDGWLFDEQQYIWEFPKIGVLQIIQNSTHGFRMNWEPLFWGSTMLGNPHLVTCITRTLLDPRRCPVLGHPWSCRRWNAMRCCCWRNWWRCFRAAVWPECSVETWLVALVAGCEFHPQN